MPEVDDDEWAPRPSVGRVATSARRVRLSDAGPDGRLRLDGVARYLQDAAMDDSYGAGYGTGLGTDDVWVVRQTTMRTANGGQWPVLGDWVELATWCGGLGRAWAIRRTQLSVGGDVAVDTSARWVHLDGRGRPARLSDGFVATYAAAAGGRSATARLDPPLPPSAASATKPWLTRVVDLDVVGHVNNAAVWAAIVDALGPQPGSVRSATVAHHGAIGAHDDVTLHVEGGGEDWRMWMVVGADVRVVASVR